MESFIDASAHAQQVTDDILQGRVPLLVSEQAGRAPAKIALVTHAVQLTYSDLNSRASTLAVTLQQFGAGAEIVIGICLPRSAEFVIAALGIMKAGAAYLPLDPAHPAERLQFIARDAGVLLVITNHELGSQFVDAGIQILEINDVGAEARIADPTSPISSDQLAYVIYTSGSTGQPKGVEVTHANLSHLVAWHLRAFGLTSADRVTFLSGVGFDAAVWDLWPALAAGATICLPNESIRLSAEALRDWLVSERITLSFVPTALAEQLLDLTWPAETALRFLLTGADTLHRYPPPNLPFALVNNYGPTECTVVSTSGIVAPNDHTTLPTLGTPIDRVQIHILDEQQREVPDGGTGEIYIGGAGVARAYRNSASLTAERFLTQKRLYRTGDLGRRLPNGEIAFLGRLDDQVKIRGHRIELNEINAVLRQHPAVQVSTVIVREDSPNEKRLVAYVVPRSCDCDEDDLRETLRRRLPDYMEPGAFVFLPTLPLTPNGKVNRAALRRPVSPNENYKAPRTPLEETLARIMSEVLKVERVSVEDDFFHLGAHSLLGAQVVARVREEIGIEIKLLDVFDGPTVAELAEKIEQNLVAQLAAMSDSEVEAALADAGNG